MDAGAAGPGTFQDFAGLLGGAALYCLPPQVETEIDLTPPGVGADAGVE